MGKPMLQEEKRYIEEMGGKMTHAVIAQNLTTLFGNNRRTSTVASYLARINDRAAPKVSRNAAILVPKGKPVIKNDRLLRAMTYTDTGCREVAKAAGLSIEQVQGLVARGGIPKPYADPVRAYYKAMGERV